MGSLFFSSYLRNEIEKRESNTVRVNRAEAGVELKENRRLFWQDGLGAAADYANINPGERPLSVPSEDGGGGEDSAGIILFVRPLRKHVEVSGQGLSDTIASVQKRPCRPKGLSKLWIK